MHGPEGEHVGPWHKGKTLLMGSRLSVPKVQPCGKAEGPQRGP